MADPGECQWSCPEYLARVQGQDLPGPLIYSGPKIAHRDTIKDNNILDTSESGT